MEEYIITLPVSCSTENLSDFIDSCNSAINAALNKKVK